MGHAMRKQSDQSLHCPHTESLDTIECFNAEKIPRRDIARARDKSETVHFGLRLDKASYPCSR